jgi:hypothetical protein
MKRLVTAAGIVCWCVTAIAGAEEAKPVASYFSTDYFTDASGGLTLTADADTGLQSGTRLRLGAGWTDAQATALDKGWLIKFGAATDPSNAWNYGLNIDYWRFPAAANPDDGLTALVGTTSITHAGEYWVVTLSPILRTLQFRRTPLPEVYLNSAGVSATLNYYASGNWSFGAGGEYSRYFTDTPNAIATIFNNIKQTGNAPFVASLVRSRYYLEAGYQLTRTGVTVGVERSDTLASPPGKYDPSVYINTNTVASDRWSVRTTLGATRLDNSGWYASLGFTYTR